MAIIMIVKTYVKQGIFFLLIKRIYTKAYNLYDDSMPLK